MFSKVEAFTPGLHGVRNAVFFLFPALVRTARVSQVCIHFVGHSLRHCIELPLCRRGPG